jgi:hypothetical protein
LSAVARRGGAHAPRGCGADGRKLRRSPYNLRYLIYKIENDSQIVIGSTGRIETDYKRFYEVLSEVNDECGYALVDLEVTTSDGRPTSQR